MSARPIAFVTGGAKRIGAAICRRLAQTHDIIIHCHRSEAEAQALRQALQADGAGAQVVSFDLGNPEDIGTHYALAVARFGTPEVLVNNASLFLTDTLETLTPEGFSQNLAVNLMAPVLLAQAFAAALPAPRKGAIINLIDQRVLRPTPQYASYTLAKAGLHMATKTLAQALAPRIRVNGIGPGPTIPNIHDGTAGFAIEAFGTLLETAVAPEAIAEAVAFLAGAAHITGQMLAVDSGQHLGWRTPDIVD